MKPNTKVDWTKLDPLLGTMPDPVLAAKLGVSKQRVHQRRNFLGIAKCPYTPETLPKEVQNLLGARTDVALAARFNLPVHQIRACRTRLGLPAYRELHWGDIDRQLGTMPDGKLAKKVGMSPGAVYNRRKAKGIPACCPKGKKK